MKNWFRFSDPVLEFVENGVMWVPVEAKPLVREIMSDERTT